MGTGFSIVIFAATLVATLVVSYLGRRHEARHGGGALARQGLNRWLVGLSAGATANSGFVVTAAVGLGYSYGARWLLLPLAWLVGDAVFWLLFPQRINRLGAEAKATTLTDVVAHGFGGRTKRSLQVTIGLITLVCLGGYVSAQWLSGQKFLSGAFGLGNMSSLFAFAAVIVVYSALGGFRGSVYADTLQAAIRIIGTMIALVAVWVAASRDPEAFRANIEAAGPDFLRLVPSGGIAVALLTSAGFAAAALGFGLGQPQIVTRYLAGASPKETQSAWWIYMLFVQTTWLAMTGFGIALRGVMPVLNDPETGLSAFHRATTGPVVTGIIAADIFATIAATSNSILVAMAQSVTVDLLPRRAGPKGSHGDLWVPIAILGVGTMAVSLFLHNSVMDLALSSVGMMGGRLSPGNDDQAPRLAAFRYLAADGGVGRLRNGSGLAVHWSQLGHQRSGPGNRSRSYCQPEHRLSRGAVLADGGYHMSVVARHRGILHWKQKRAVIKFILGAFTDREVFETVLSNRASVGPMFASHVDALQDRARKWDEHRPFKDREFFDLLAVKLGCPAGTTGLSIVECPIDDFIGMLPETHRENARRTVTHSVCAHLRVGDDLLGAEPT